MNLYTRNVDTPFGQMVIAVDEDARLTRLIFPNGQTEWTAEIAKKGHSLRSASTQCDFVVVQLDEYFEGKRQHFEFALNPEGTPFQLKVWRALTTIAYGATISYRELAERIGSPAAVRAVGAANGANPIPIVVPCHRVIGADGSLIGFGGGLVLKEGLLKLEGAELRRVRGKARIPSHQLALL